MSIKRRFLSNNDPLLTDAIIEKTIIKNYSIINEGPVQKIIVHSEVGAFNNIEQWENQLNLSFSLDTAIRNYDFSFAFAENAKDKNSTEQNFSSPFYSIDGQFNYYSDYLDKSDITNEKDLLSFYLFYENEENKKYRDISSLPMVKQLSKPLFSNFVYNYSSQYIMKSDTSLGVISNTLFGTDYNLTKNFNKKGDFPIYNEVKFSYQDHTNILKSNLNKANLLEHFICNMLYTPMAVDTMSIGLQQPASIRYTDLFSIVDNFTNHSENKIILSKKDMTTLTSMSFLRRSILTSAIVDITSKHRTFHQLILQEGCETEMLFFRVDKYAGNVGGVPIQTYHVPANSDVISILDTQVFHDTTYFYVVTAYVIVYGTEYSYSIDKSYEDRGKFKSEIVVNTKPSARIYEVEVFRDSSTIIETPLNKPGAVFINSSDSSNKIIFKIEQPLMGLESEFNEISFSDATQRELMKQSVTDSRKYKFKHSKIQTKYQVYRMNTKPKSYLDFDANLIDEIDSEYNSSILISEDYILPNKKYYYTFRAINITGKLSNPSAVYEVELVKNGDQSRVVTKVIDFESHKPEVKSMPFKQLMQVLPADEQRFFDPEDEIIVNANSYSDLFHYINLGAGLDRQLWNRKFKFRIKSKSTGKVLDFNIKFKIKKIKDVEDLK
tara:strand:+ start:18263 stop:20254 length:1992 start_codon:yes stop_codon:yes gene_type:complete